MLIRVFIISCLLFSLTPSYAGNSGRTEAAVGVDTKQGYLKQFRESAAYRDSFKNNSIREIRESELRYYSYPFLVFLLITFILMFIKITNPDFYKELFSHLGNSRLLLTVFPVRGISLRISNVFIDISKLFVLSLLVFEISNDYFRVNFWLILTAILAFTVLRMILVNIFFPVFFEKRSLNVHMSNIFIYNRIMFLFILPMSFFSIFTFPPYTHFFQSLAILTILIFILLRSFRIFTQIKFSNNYSFFYIFLYICIFEISPYFVALKEISQIV